MSTIHYQTDFYNELCINVLNSVTQKLGSIKKDLSSSETKTNDFILDHIAHLEGILGHTPEKEAYTDISSRLSYISQSSRCHASLCGQINTLLSELVAYSSSRTQIESEGFSSLFISSTTAWSDPRLPELAKNRLITLAMEENVEAIKELCILANIGETWAQEGLSTLPLTNVLIVNTIIDIACASKEPSFMMDFLMKHLHLPLFAYSAIEKHLHENFPNLMNALIRFSKEGSAPATDIVCSILQKNSFLFNLYISIDFFKKDLWAIDLVLSLADRKEPWALLSLLDLLARLPSEGDIFLHIMKQLLAGIDRPEYKNILSIISITPEVKSRLRGTARLLGNPKMEVMEIHLADIEKKQRQLHIMQDNNFFPACEDSQAEKTKKYILFFLQLERLDRLENLLKGNPIPSIGVATSKCFPHVTSLFLGLEHYKDDPINLDELDSGLLKYMEKVNYDLYLNTIISHPRAVKPYSYNIQIPTYDWIQDSCTIHNNHGHLALSVPQIVPEIFAKQYEKAVLDGLGLCEDDSTLGSVAQLYAQFSAVQMAYLLKKNIQFDLCYSEGGNVLIGGGEDRNRYIIVGQATWIWTKEMLKSQCSLLGMEYEITDDVVRVCLAHDYGITPDKVYPVPHYAFHIDMEMQLIGEKKVILNDSMQAFALDTEHLDPVAFESQISDYKKKCIIASKLESQAEEELKSYGFEVIRIAGRRYDLSKKLQDKDAHPEVINMFNFVSGITPANKAFIIALHMPPAEFSYFIDHVVSKIDIPRTQEDNPHELRTFLIPQEISEELLSISGGIACRTKQLEVSVF